VKTVSGFEFQVLSSLANSKLETLNLKPMIIGIVAVDRNLAIGKDGKLPWHYSADMRFFKETTIGKAVVMGRHTWLTLKGPLKERQNIVLSRSHGVQPTESLTVKRSLDDVIDFASKLDCHLFIIGGAKVLRIVPAPHSKMDCD
jgi:dihydrofolate reductase